MKKEYLDETLVEIGNKKVLIDKNTYRQEEVSICKINIKKLSMISKSYLLKFLTENNFLINKLNKRYIEISMTNWKIYKFSNDNKYLIYDDNNVIRLIIDPTFSQQVFSLYRYDLIITPIDPDSYEVILNDHELHDTVNITELVNDIIETNEKVYAIEKSRIEKGEVSKYSNKLIQNIEKDILTFIINELKIDFKSLVYENKGDNKRLEEYIEEYKKRD